MKYYTHTSIFKWNILLVGDEKGISNLHLSIDPAANPFDLADSWQHNDIFFQTAIKQLHEYFSGIRKQFNLNLRPEGTDFQQRVWQELTRIPFGETRSYKDVATALGNPNSCRAVGMANSKNPIPIIIPCHRVIGSSGKLTGYALGLDIKETLLNHENPHNN